MDSNYMDSETIIEKWDKVMEEYVETLYGDNENEETTLETVLLEDEPETEITGLVQVENPSYLTLTDLQVALSPISALLLCLCFIELTKSFFAKLRKGE